VVGISAAQYEQLQRSPLFLRLCNEGKVSVDHEEASGEAGRQDSAAAGAYDLEKARLIKAVAEQDAELAALRATVSRQSEELDELRQRLRRKQQRGNESLGDAAALAQPDE
jgi:hypothetical protein